MDSLASTNYHPKRLNKNLYTYSSKLYQDNEQVIVEQMTIMENILKEFVLIDSLIISLDWKEYLEYREELYERKYDPTNNNNSSIMVKIKSMIIDQNSCQYQQLTLRLLSPILTFMFFQSSNNIFFEWGIQIKIELIKVPFKKLRIGIIYTYSSSIDADQNTHEFSSGFQANNLKLNHKKLNILLMVGQNYFDEVRLDQNNINKHTQYNWFSDTRLKNIQKEEQIELQNLIFSEHKKTEIQFIYFFLPGSKQICMLYKACKQMSLDLGISSQIVFYSTLEKKYQTSFYKMLIQVSSKIGYRMIEIIPKDFQENTLVCGIKYLRTKQDKLYFSIVSSINYQFTQYHSQIKLIDQSLTQKSKVLQDSFFNSLTIHSKFCDQNELKNIIIYHDGVSQGEEVRQCDDIRNDIYFILQQVQLVGIRVTLIFCSKNSIQKFYIFQNQQKINFEHGSVISDSKLCQDNQFYLQIKELSTQLSSNPTSYKVYDFKIPNELAKQHLFDQIANVSFYSQIQHLTYQLCWLYFSFTGPIKIPAPLKYALRLCNFYQKNDFKIPLVIINILEEKNYLYYI